jgi:D-glycero-D-manno-heptose 1,7-bisphosphate phosphatase
MKHRAIFLDRDGTISDEVGYVNHPSRLRVLPGSAEAIRRLNESGWLAVVITNQSGVARGYFTEAILHETNEVMRRELFAAGARIDGLYYCPHHPSAGEAPYRQDCDCRKPKPGLITRAAEDLGIDLAQSWMIGDRYGDVAMAYASGVRSALVLTGYGRGEWEYQSGSWEHRPEIVADDLLGAVGKIMMDVAAERPSG